MRGSFLIRFIDIGLIILFGFLMISDIEIYSQVRMPGIDEDSSREDPRRMSMVTVRIRAEGYFDVVELEAGRSTGGIDDPAALQELLREINARYQSKGRHVVVLIQPDDDSIVQQTVDVLDICDREGILKNINIEALKL